MANPAEGYESYMVPTLFGPWASRLVQSTNPQPGERALDVACGTGVVARRVAPLVGPTGEVTGLDLNPYMLQVARVAASREGAVVSWHEGPAEQMPFPDSSFDLVLCQFGLMFFADRQAALAEAHRVLKKDGRIGLSVWQDLDRHPFYQRLHAVIQRRVGISALQDIFALGNADELSRLLAAAGFQRVEIEPVSMTARFPNPEAFIAGEIEVDTAAIPSMQALDDQARKTIAEAISADIKGPLNEVTQDDHVVLPFHAHLALATR